MDSHVFGSGDWKAFYEKCRPVKKEDLDKVEEHISALAETAASLSARLGNIEQQYTLIINGIDSVNRSIEELKK